jgi:hypothetical protein
MMSEIETKTKISVIRVISGSLAYLKIQDENTTNETL